MIQPIGRASASSAALGLLADSRASTSAKLWAAARYCGWPKTSATALAMRPGADRLPIRTPAPSLSTRAVLSFWSRPIGMQTSGTPAAKAFITLPCPEWVTTADASARTRRCGAARNT